ncbi:MAG UNVERIFIED_CONTAM: hypothetical protein LVR18_18015 [Planctomycetaceae bacterium]
MLGRNRAGELRFGSRLYREIPQHLVGKLLAAGRAGVINPHQQVTRLAGTVEIIRKGTDCLTEFVCVPDRNRAFNLRCFDVGQQAPTIVIR